MIKSFPKKSNDQSIYLSINHYLSFIYLIQGLTQTHYVKISHWQAKDSQCVLPSNFSHKFLSASRIDRRYTSNKFQGKVLTLNGEKC